MAKLHTTILFWCRLGMQYRSGMTRYLGSRIIVVGVSAAGKSTCARRLSQKVDIPVVCMDAIMWTPGWVYVGDEETKKRLDEISSRGEWLIEGYITTQVRVFIFERADVIVYLDYSRTTVVWRYVKRWWMHRVRPRQELPGSPDMFSFKTLWMIWRKKEAETLELLLAHVRERQKIVRLHSPEEAERWLQG